MMCVRRCPGLSGAGAQRSRAHAEQARAANRRAGITLLELLLVAGIAAILVWIALPTLYPDKAELQLLFAKEQLVYLYQKEQAYFRLYGSYAPLSELAADEHIGRDYDQRFTEDAVQVDGVNFIGPQNKAPTFEIVAMLPDGTRYSVDQSGEVRLLTN